MEWLFTLVLGALALFYICQPLWAGASAGQKQSRFEGWHSLEQLEIDRQLGKIDDAEFEELKARVPVAAPVEPPFLEALISRVRRQKRANLSLESEILITRARKRSQKSE